MRTRPARFRPPFASARMHRRTAAQGSSKRMQPGSSALGLVGDIGGTSARFALVALNQPRPRFLVPESRPVADYGDLSEAAGDYIADQWYLGKPLSASIAVAG